MPHDHRLLFHGFLLFLLGLVTGLIAYRLENPRMGVSAHVLPPLVCGTTILWGLRRGAHAA